MNLDLLTQFATLCMFFFPDKPMTVGSSYVPIYNQNSRLECFKTLSKCVNESPKNVLGDRNGYGACVFSYVNFQTSKPL